MESSHSSDLAGGIGLSSAASREGGLKLMVGSSAEKAVRIIMFERECVCVCVCECMHMCACVCVRVGGS